MDKFCISRIYTGDGKIIAVLDAGFPGVNTAQPFENLRNNNRILGGYDFTTRNANFYTGGSHGTLVLSTMGGYKENALIGTAPNASYYFLLQKSMLWKILWKSRFGLKLLKEQTH